MVDDPGAREESAAFIRFPTLDPRRSESEDLLSPFASFSDRIRFAAMVAELVISMNKETSWSSPDFSCARTKFESLLPPISSRSRSLAAAAQYRILFRKDDLWAIKPCSLSDLLVSCPSPPLERLVEDATSLSCSSLVDEPLLGEEDPFCLVV